MTKDERLAHLLQPTAKKQRLAHLLQAMALGQDIKGTTLTVREAAEFANRLPVDDNVSSVHADIRELIARGDVEELDAGTRKYKVIKHDPKAAS
jgi:hypothetical protein